MREQRLHLNWSQESLAQRSGVSYGTLKKFEQTGQISLASLLKLAAALNALEDFAALFAKEQVPASLDELIKNKSRKRGRK